LVEIRLKYLDDQILGMTINQLWMTTLIDFLKVVLRIEVANLKFSNLRVQNHSQI